MFGRKRGDKRGSLDRVWGWDTIRLVANPVLLFIVLDRDITILKTYFTAESYTWALRRTLYGIFMFFLSVRYISIPLNNKLTILIWRHFEFTHDDIFRLRIDMYCWRSWVPLSVKRWSSNSWLVCQRRCYGITRMFANAGQMTVCHCIFGDSTCPLHDLTRVILAFLWDVTKFPEEESCRVKSQHGKQGVRVLTYFRWLSTFWWEHFFAGTSHGPWSSWSASWW